MKNTPYLCTANSKQMVQTYGVMVAQQILVLLVEVRILIGLQALRQKWRRAFLKQLSKRNTL